MKRLLTFFFFICTATISVVANNGVKGNVIDLTCTVIDPRPTPVTRAPQVMPIVSVEGNTLFLNNSFFQDIVVQIQDNQGNIVYYVNVPYGINSIAIPTSVSDGEYQLFFENVNANI
ncbi:hypothetical protein [Segatella paludivivens]|uniref:hypothetical protein n=1 Tax=Segatella paludivivens TaxID=185294 RepID=UPI000470856F|nr:hypothetical protein [Segatella paludivivens]